jgi:putative ABC transport system substrate-binding protein
VAHEAIGHRPPTGGSPSRPSWGAARHPRSDGGEGLSDRRAVARCVSSRFSGSFREGLRDLGYVEGKTIVIEWRFADGKNERLTGLAEELVRLNVDVIFAVNTPAAFAAKKATTTIPIVIARLADPTKTGLVPSLARPGGNITGVSSIAEELATKRLELVRDTLPKVTRIVMLFNPDNPGHLQVVKDTVQANTQLGFQLDTHGVRGASDLPEIFQAATRGRAQALLVQDDVRVTTVKREILDQAARLSLPVFAQYREFVEGGALVTFAAAVAGEHRQAASYVDRILKGAKPAGSAKKSAWYATSDQAQWRARRALGRRGRLRQSAAVCGCDGRHAARWVSLPGDPKTASLYPFADTSPPTLSEVEAGTCWSPRGFVESPRRGTAHALSPGHAPGLPCSSTRE